MSTQAVVHAKLATVAILGALLGSAALAAGTREGTRQAPPAEDRNVLGTRVEASVTPGVRALSPAAPAPRSVTALAGGPLDLRLDISTWVSATGGNWNDIASITGLTTGLVDFHTGAPTPVSIQGAGWRGFYGDEAGAFPNRDWLIQPATVDGAGLDPGQTGTFVLSGLPADVYRIEVVTARHINYLNTITVNGAPASRTSLGTPVQTPWGSAADGLTPGNWLIWDGVAPVAGAITITNEAASGTLAMINAVRVLGSSAFGEQVIPTLSGLGALLLALAVAGGAYRILRG